MGIFNKKIQAAKQPFTVPITLERESEADAKLVACSLSVIAGFFGTKELSAIGKALANPAVRALIRSRL